MSPTGIDKMLFKRNNIPMTFVLLRLSQLEFDELKKLIVDNGGACSIGGSNARIKFTTQSSYSREMCPGSVMYDVQFIRMCVMSGRIVEPDIYRLSGYYLHDECLMLHFLFGCCECSIPHQQEQQQQKQQQQQPEAVADNETTPNRQMTMRVSMEVTTNVRNGEETNNTPPEDESQVVVPYPQVTNPQAPSANGGKDVSEQGRNRGTISSFVASCGQFVSDFEECSHRDDNDNELLTLGLPKKPQKTRTATTLTANSKSQSVESRRLNDVAKWVAAAQSPVHSEASTLLVQGLRSPNEELRSRSTMTNERRHEDVGRRHEDVGRRAQKHCASPTHISDCSPPRKCTRGNIDKEKTGVFHQVVNPFYKKTCTPKPAIKIASELIPVMHRHAFEPVRTAIKIEEESIGRNIETSQQLASPIGETIKMEHREAGDDSAWNQPGPSGLTGLGRLGPVKTDNNVSPRRNEIPDYFSEESTLLHPRSRKSTKHSAVENSHTDIDEISDFADSDEPENRQKGRRLDFDPKRTNAWKHKTVAKKLIHKAPYTDQERYIMLRYLIRTGTIHLAKGIKVFQEMAEEPGLRHRTPMSLNLHFLRHILPYVDKFAIAFKLDKASVAKLKKLAG